MSKERENNKHAQLELKDNSSQLLHIQSILDAREKQVTVLQSRLEEETQLTKILRSEIDQSKLSLDTFQHQIDDLINERLNFLEEIEILKKQLNVANVVEDSKFECLSHEANEDEKR